MAVALTGTGGLFTRIGDIGGAVNSVISFINSGDLSGGGVLSVGVATDAVRSEYASARTDLIANLYPARDTYRTAHQTYLAALQAIAKNTLIGMVHDDNPLPAQTLALAMEELISQMEGSSDDVDASTTSATPATGSANVGNGACVATVKRTDGRDNEHVYAEDIVITCTADAVTGSATQFSETFTAKGEAAAASPLAYNWPAGSGALKTLTAVNASGDNATGNKLTNSDFETFTVADTPDNWTILVGVAGTDINESSDKFYGTKCLEILGDGATLTSIAQTFNSVSGTLGTLKPNTVYIWNAWMKRDTSLAGGVLAVELVDGSNSVIADDAGNNNATSITLSSGLTTSYAAKNGVFVTPANLPTTVKLRIRLTTAATSGESFYIDRLALTEVAEPLYTGGPFAAVFAGATASLKNDNFTVAVANNHAGTFQKLFWRLFDMPTLGLQLPSDTGGSETINDNLVTA